MSTGRVHLVLRIGEVFLKGANRHLFLRQLEQNLKRALATFPDARLKRFYGRYLVECSENTSVFVSQALVKVFGLTSLSPVVLVSVPSIEDFSHAAIDLVRQLPRPSSFCVRARRTDKHLPFTSMDVEREVGSAIGSMFFIPVNLSNPELVVEAHAGEDISFVCVERFPGAGGLPVGVSGRVEALLSGGIDSPVAVWLMLKRGAAVNATSFYSPPWVGEEAREKVENLCRKLRPWGGPNKLHMVAYGEVQKRLRECRPHKLATVLYRRMMMRTASLIARRNRAMALVTGESLGQVASQTLPNLVAIDRASPLPVLRPLLAFDKTETIELARRIGTYEASIVPCPDSCTLFAPDHPETCAKMEAVLSAEEGLNVTEMARELADAAICIHFRDENESSLVTGG